MRKFLQGRAIVFNVWHVGRNGRIQFSRKSVEHLDGTECDIHFNHELRIGKGRLKIQGNGLWYEIPLDGAELQIVEGLLKAGKIRGSSYSMHGVGELQCDSHGDCEHVHRVSKLVECGPVERPAEILTSCTLSERSIFGMRRIEMRSPPAPVQNANKLMVAALAGSGCEIRGRHLSPGQVQALVSGGPSAVIL